MPSPLTSIGSIGNGLLTPLQVDPNAPASGDQDDGISAASSRIDKVTISSAAQQANEAASAPAASATQRASVAPATATASAPPAESSASPSSTVTSSPSAEAPPATAAGPTAATASDGSEGPAVAVAPSASGASSASAEPSEAATPDEGAASAARADDASATSAESPLEAASEQATAAAATAAALAQLQTPAPKIVEEPAKVTQRVQLTTLLSPWLRQSGTNKSQMTSDLYRGLRSANWAEPPKRMETTTDASSFRWGVEMKRGAGVAVPSFVGESKGVGASGPRPFAVSAYDSSERVASPKKDDASINPIRWTGFGAFIRHD